MARTVDPKTGGLYFECREDLSPEFDRVPVFKTGFELPLHVDFRILLGRHRDASDFRFAREALTDADLYLFEGGVVHPDYADALQDVATGDDSALNSFEAHARLFRLGGFQLAQARGLHASRVPATMLDPPIGHKVLTAMVALAEVGHLLQVEELRVRWLEMIQKRDQWALNSLKKTVNTILGKPSNNTRRKVVISRGLMHYGFAHAVARQCELKPEFDCTVEFTSFNLNPGDGGAFSEMLY